MLAQYFFILSRVVSISVNKKVVLSTRKKDLAAKRKVLINYAKVNND